MNNCPIHFSAEDIKISIDNGTSDVIAVKAYIIYHSHTGTTRAVAERVQAACGGELIEVKLKEGHSSPVAYFLGLFRSLYHQRNPIEPAAIDVSSADVVVIGTPVWTRRATPAITAAVGVLQGCRGKKAVLFATCGAIAGDTLPLLAGALEARGVHIAGQFILIRHDLPDGDPGWGPYFAGFGNGT